MLFVHQTDATPFAEEKFTGTKHRRSLAIGMMRWISGMGIALVHNIWTKQSTNRLIPYSTCQSTSFAFDFGYRFDMLVVLGRHNRCWCYALTGNDGIHSLVVVADAYIVYCVYWMCNHSVEKNKICLSQLRLYFLRCHRCFVTHIHRLPSLVAKKMMLAATAAATMAHRKSLRLASAQTIILYVICVPHSSPSFSSLHRNFPSHLSHTERVRCTYEKIEMDFYQLAFRRTIFMWARKKKLGKYPNLNEWDNIENEREISVTLLMISSYLFSGLLFCELSLAQI